VNKDPFWSAEVVQIVADTTYLGEISLRMIPRSGNFEIEFGILDKCDKKLAKLHKFYEKGLPYVGWERYKVVDVRYDKQIICRE
jgi:cell division protein FtsQ